MNAPDEHAHIPGRVRIGSCGDYEDYPEQHDEQEEDR